jgi:hypothetical protein
MSLALPSSTTQDMPFVPPEHGSSCDLLSPLFQLYPRFKTFLNRFSKARPAAGCQSADHCDTFLINTFVFREGEGVMVRNSSGTPSADSFRPLNPPIPVDVREFAHQIPLAIKIKRRWRRVVSIDDMCNVDEEWWRERPIVRMYYRVNMEDGRRITVFRDMQDGAWYLQNA